METLSECPLCSGKTNAPCLQAKDYTVSGELFNIVKCLTCGFKFTNPRPAAEEGSRYYESDEYISHSNTGTGLINRTYQIIRAVAIAQKVKMIKNRMGDIRGNEIKILDVGCGTGEFLNSCKKEGWSVSGIEPSAKARNYAKQKYGLHAEEPACLEKFPPAAFHCITLWHVLEHIYPLNATLATLKRLLKHGGILVVALPNCQSPDEGIYKEYWAAYDVPRHLYHFSPDTVFKLLRKNNFEIKRVLPMYFDAFYISMLSEKYRKGNIGIGMLNGLLSNCRAMLQGGNFSSQIYVAG